MQSARMIVLISHQRKKMIQIRMNNPRLRVLFFFILFFLLEFRRFPLSSAMTGHMWQTAVAVCITLYVTRMCHDEH